MNKFFSELKRRNVVRVGIAYVVVAWVTLQFVDIVSPLMGLPEVFQKGVLVLLAIGFPVTLLISWAYEVTPEGVKKTAEVDASKSITHGTGQKINKLIIAGLALVVAFFVYDKFVAETPITIGESAREASIAVLPFADLSPDSSQEYFGDGIAEEILNVLAKNPEMKVAGRTSSFKFKGQNENLQLIAEQLNVDHVLEGSVRKDGNKIRVTVQLIAADDGFHLWSETYDRDLVDIFAIQDEISRAVANAMQIQLGTSEGNEKISPKTIASAEAYSLYLQGMQLLHARGEESLEKAGKFLEVVTILDPDFDPAFAGLARVYSLYPAYAVTTGPEADRAFAQAKIAANRAIFINPQNALAYSALTFVHVYEFEWGLANQSNLMAITLAPNDAEIANFAGDYYRFIGDFENAFKWESKAFDLDPLHVVNSWDMAFVHFDFNKSSEGLPYAENAIKVDPNYSFVFQVFSYILADLDRFEEAKDAIEQATQANQSPFIIKEMYVYLALSEGKFDEARKLLLEMEKMVEVGQGAPSWLHMHYLALGDLDRGLYWFERAYAEKDPNLTAAPDFLPENYTDDPEILARFNLPGMKELFEIRRANMARNAEGADE